MKIHYLKLEGKYQLPVFDGIKTFELRKDDRDYEVGDFIHFTNVDKTEIEFHGNNLFEITYILRNTPIQYGLNATFCILGIKKLNITD